MELTLIVAVLLAATAGLAVAVAYALRPVAVHRQELAVWELVPARIRSPIAPGWLFSVSAVLGLSVIALAGSAG